MIREARGDDLEFMWEMLWEAAAVAEAMRAMGKAAALAVPEISRYLDNWGRPGDAAIVAIGVHDRLLGAAWFRLFRKDAAGYGFVARDIPELTIAVSPKARNQGVGGSLLGRLMAIARTQGYRAISLAVDRRNPARYLYERLGFRIVPERCSGDALIMIAVL